jgi:hypothetical protein
MYSRLTATLKVAPEAAPSSIIITDTGRYTKDNPSVFIKNIPRIYLSEA